MPVQYRVDLAETGRPFPHYWELCIGSCHAALILRADMQEHIKKIHDAIGFRYLRFHGLFDDDMSVVIDGMIPGITPRQISFFNIDRIFDFLLSIGMKPFVELGFMPEALASGSATCFHYKANVTMPKKEEEWTELVTLFVEHLIERYGKDEVRQWYFEVWNEPNLRLFFEGTQEDYFRLYELSARAIKKVDPTLRVGGPATSNNKWIPEFRHFCETNDVPYDFISTHQYPIDDPLSTAGMNGPGTLGEGFDFSAVLQEGENPDLLLEKLAQYRNSGNNNPRDILYQMAKKAKAEAGEHPLFYTEWNGGRGHFDTNYAAASITQALAYNEGLVECYSFWCISDIFEEMGMHGLPYNDERGLVNVYGVPKPNYRIFEELSKTGDRRLTVEGEHRTAEILALEDDQTVTLFVYNHDIEERDIKAEEIELTLLGEAKAITMAVIDAVHANPIAVWKKQGSPTYPTPEQIAELYRASELTVLDLPVEKVLSFTAEPESVTILKIKK